MVLFETNSPPEIRVDLSRIEWMIQLSEADVIR